MIAGRVDEVDGQYVGTRLIALLVPGGTRFVTGSAAIPIRFSGRSLMLAYARVWVPALGVAWPWLLGGSVRAFIEAVMWITLGLATHRLGRLPETEKKALRILGTQTGLRIDPTKLLPATRKAKLEMLEHLMNKGGLTCDPEWLEGVLEEIPGPALPLVYAYARYASDAPPWSTFAAKVLEQIDRAEF